MSELTLNGIVSFSQETGLIPHTKSEIYDDLKLISKTAFGSDLVIQEGSEWYSFLDLMAGSLANVAGSALDLYNALSFTSASGIALDNVVSLAGISRKSKQNSSVLIKATANSSVTRPYTIYAGELIIQDTNGVQWKNTDNLVIERYAEDGETENYVGTATFAVLDTVDDPYGIYIGPNNGGTNTNWVVMTGNISSNITFINEIASVYGRQQETDAQLRARYQRSLYKQSTGTNDALIAKLLDSANINYVYIIDNSAKTPANYSAPYYGVPKHHIWVIVDGVSTWDGTGVTSLDAEDINIANIILNYKSMGAGTSYGASVQDTSSYPSTPKYEDGQGAIPVEITIDNVTYKIWFTRAAKVNTYISLSLTGTVTDDTKKATIVSNIKNNIINYINGLGINNDVLYGGVASSIFKVNSDSGYTDYVFDIASLFINTSANPVSGSRVEIDAFQYANITANNIAINWS